MQNNLLLKEDAKWPPVEADGGSKRRKTASSCARAACMARSETVVSPDDGKTIRSKSSKSQWRTARQRRNFYFCPRSSMEPSPRRLRGIDTGALRRASAAACSKFATQLNYRWWCSFTTPSTLSFIDPPEASEGKIPRCFPDTNNTKSVISALSAAPLTYSH